MNRHQVVGHWTHWAHLLNKQVHFRFIFYLIFFLFILSNDRRPICTVCCHTTTTTVATITTTLHNFVPHTLNVASNCAHTFARPTSATTRIQNDITHTHSVHERQLHRNSLHSLQHLYFLFNFLLFFHQRCWLKLSPFCFCFSGHIPRLHTRSLPHLNAFFVTLGLRCTFGCVRVCVRGQTVDSHYTRTLSLSTKTPSTKLDAANIWSLPFPSLVAKFAFFSYQQQKLPKTVKEHSTAKTNFI